MDTVWATVKVRRSVLAEASERMPGMSNAAIVQRALEKMLANPQAKGGTPERSSTGISAPASASSRASSRGAAGGGAGRKDGVSHDPAPPARKVPAGPQASPPSDATSSASQGREVEAGVNGGAGAAPEFIQPPPLSGEAFEALRQTGDYADGVQTTVEEMLASCPNCAGAFKRAVDRVAPVCEDCGYVREPS
jgi:hypothetical protein